MSRNEKHLSPNPKGLVVFRHRVVPVVALSFALLILSFQLGCTPMPAPTPNISATVGAAVRATLAVPTPVATPDIVARRLEDFNRFIRACYNGEPRLAEFSPSDQQAFRRAINRASDLPYGSYLNMAKRAYVSTFCQFKGIEPITNFYQNDDIETAFLSYLIGPKPTQAALRRELVEIICAFQAEPAITSFTGARFKELFGSPYQAAAVSISPYFLGGSSSERSASFTTFMDLLADKFSINPERYQGDEGILNVFRETKVFNKNCPEDGEPTDATAVDPPTALDPEDQKRLDAFNEWLSEREVGKGPMTE